MTRQLDTTASPLTTQWHRINRLHAQVEHALATALQQQHNLGLSDYRALQAIAVSPDGELRLQELADAVGLNQSSVSRLVNRLDAAGLTVRDVCEGDRRGVYSVITDRGRACLAEMRPVYESTLRTALEDALRDPDLGEIAGMVGSTAVY